MHLLLGLLFTLQQALGFPLPAALVSGPGGNDIAYFFRFAFQSEIDTLTNTGVLQTDPAKRREVYNRIQSLLADQTPVIFLYWQDSIMLIPRGLQGFQPSPFTPLFWNVVQWR